MYVFSAGSRLVFKLKHEGKRLRYVNYEYVQIAYFASIFTLHICAVGT